MFMCIVDRTRPVLCNLIQWNLSSLDTFAGVSVIEHTLLMKGDILIFRDAVIEGSHCVVDVRP